MKKTISKVFELQKAYIEKIRSCTEKYFIYHEGKKLVIKPNVFPPYLDSHIIIKSLKIEKHQNVLDVCSGSGIIGIFACDKAKHVTATDINPSSIDNIVENAVINNFEGKLTAVQADLFPSDMSCQKYDVIIFNPPYTDHDTKDIIEKSVWDKDHLTVKRFFRLVHNHLNTDGVIYLGWADFADFKFIEDLIIKSGFSYRIIIKKSDGISIFAAYELKKNITVP